MTRNSGKRTSEDIGMEVIGAMDREFHQQPDRVVAIVGAAYLDSTLESLLRAVFVDSTADVDSLLGPNGALGANGARLQVAYCLGLITRDQRDDLRAIGRIRNRFAHNFNVTGFGDAPIRDYCMTLRSPADLAAMPNQLFSADVAEQMAEFLAQTTATPRERFITSVIFLFGALLRRVHFVRRENHQWFSYDPDAPNGPSTPS